MNSQVQETKMQQKLTPQQIMLTKLLQMPVTMLEQAVKNEIVNNVMLEEEPNSNTMEHLDEEEPTTRKDEGGVDSESGDDDDDYNYKEHLEHDPNERQGEHMYMAEPTMMEHLIGQMEMKELDDRQREIAYEVIGNLDDSGYLGRGLELIENDLILRNDIETNQKELEEILRVIQSLEPAGVGARTLQECLLLQLERLPKTVDVENATRILKSYFDDFAKRNYMTIAGKMKIGEEAMNEAIVTIKKLNPKPCDGSSHEEQHGQYITPDFVVKQRNERLVCAQNDGSIPKLRISEEYDLMMREWSMNAKKSSEDKAGLDFLKAQTQTAQNYIDALEQRHTTLQQTMEAIVKRQRKYFHTGEDEDLKPLSQKELAEEIGLDDSTISRVVNSKYVQTDWGTFPLKHFFTQGMTTDSGEEVSVAAIKTVLKEVIDGEDKTAPLTDDQLVEKLKEKNISIARRTVAKYRGQLGIQSAKLRRELMGLLLIILLTLGNGAMAQKKMSYYDSILYAIEHPEKAKRAANLKVMTPKQNAPKQAAGKKRVELDTARLRGDDLKNIEYAPDEKALPSLMWYGTHFSSNRVKLENFSYDSLPDEVNIRLIKDTSEFCFPMKNIITSPYGWRWNRAHRGVDIRLNTGDPIHCAFNGVVRISKYMGGYGNVVVVRHYNGLETVYGHMSKLLVKPRQVVKAGDVLGLGGSTGRSTGPHLHFEVRFQYEPFDPEWILDFKTYTLRTRKLHLDKTYFGISKPRKGEELCYKADASYVKEKVYRKPKPVYYTVKSGDKMDKIAKRYNTTIEKIKELNPNLTRIPIGTQIRVR